MISWVMDTLLNGDYMLQRANLNLVWVLDQPMLPIHWHFFSEWLYFVQSFCRGYQYNSFSSKILKYKVNWSKNSYLYILPQEFDRKVWWDTSFYYLVFRIPISFVFMMNQRSSNKKQTNKWYQIASSVSNERTNFVRFTLQTYNFSPLIRWHRELRKGVLP